MTKMCFSPYLNGRGWNLSASANSPLINVRVFKHIVTIELADSKFRVETAPHLPKTLKQQYSILIRRRGPI